MGKSVISTITDDGIKDDYLKAKAKQELVYIDELIEVDNELFNERNLRSIDSFKNNILENGLLQPIVIIEIDSGYEILVGHKRVLAHRLLVEEGYENFEEIKAWVFPKDSLDEFEKWRVKMGTNSHTEYTIDEKRAILDKAEELYDQEVSAGRRPIGRKHEWIMALTGFGESVARRRSEGLSKNNVIASKKSVPKDRSPHLEKVEKNLIEKLLTKVKVDEKKVTFYYADASDLNRMLDIMNLLEESLEN